MDEHDTTASPQDSAGTDEGAKTDGADGGTIAAPAGEPNNSAAPESENERIARERDGYLEGWKRAKADLVNYRRDEAGRFEELLKFGQAEFVRELLAVFDSLDLGIASTPEAASPTAKGLRLIRNQLGDILKRRGLEEVKIEKGSRFDPSVSEAVREVETDLPEQAVAEVVEKGYSLNGRLLRPARVVVSRGRQAHTNDGEEGGGETAVA